MDIFKTRFYAFISSPKLTVFLLVYGVLLIFLATLDQASIGVAESQKKYFESIFCLFPTVALFGFLKIPLFGGALIGFAAIVNILASAFRYTKAGLGGFWTSVVHVSLALLIASGFIQYFTRTQAALAIAEGQTAERLTLLDSNNMPKGELKLPFKIKLINFHEEMWSGSDIPKSYSSKIAILHKDKELDFTIEMNRPASFGGWTFYQASFADGGKTSVLSAVKNPARILPWFAVGFCFLGMFVIFVTRFAFAQKGDRR